MVFLANFLHHVKQRDMQRCVSLCLHITGDLERINPNHPFSALIINDTGSHVVDKILDAATGHMLHGYDIGL